MRVIPQPLLLALPHEPNRMVKAGYYALVTHTEENSRNSALVNNTLNFKNYLWTYLDLTIS